MIKELDYLGFDSKAVKVEDKKIDNSVSFPIIAHIQSKNNFLHYVVVHDVSNKRIIISDPESGIKKVSYKEFSEIWTGILLLIEPKKDFQKRNEKDNSLSRFFYVLKNQKSLLFNIFLASILYTVLGIVTSFSSKFLIDYILKDKANCLKVFIYASLEERINRIVSVYGESDVAPEKRLKGKDKHRSLFYNYFTDMKWGDPHNYDICLNSGILGFEKCVDIISSLY